MNSGLVSGHGTSLTESAPFHSAAATSRLSKRERESLKLIAEGRAGEEIAGAMNISIKTDAFHRGARDQRETLTGQFRTALGGPRVGPAEMAVCTKRAFSPDTNGVYQVKRRSWVGLKFRRVLFSTHV